MSKRTPADTTLPSTETNESFAEALKEFESAHARKPEAGRQIEGTVVKITTDTVLVDIGFKSEGSLSPEELQRTGRKVIVGDKVLVTVKGRDPEGYYALSLFKVARPTDWTALERAFNEKATIVGTVTAVVKGGLSVDVGVRAFMPASRSGVRDAAEMEKLVEQEIRCRIIKLDTADEDVVVDRRVVLEEEARALGEQRYAEMREGDVVTGTVRSLADYGAFIDLGGVDGLLHVGEIAWSRVNKPADVLTIGQQVEAKVIKVEPEKQRISLSMKQLEPHPWEGLAERYKIGEKVRGTVTRVMEFGAFVELEPGIEGLVHVSEMSWQKKIRIASDVVKSGDTVDVVILGINPEERRISLGLKQALGDPWADVAKRFPAGAIVQGPVTNIMNFGAFVQLAEGVEGMVHVSEMSAEKRVGHPREMVKAGEFVRAQVLAIDPAKRQIKLSMKSLAPTSVDEFIAEHKAGDVVSGRVLEASGGSARVELAEGVYAQCTVPMTKVEEPKPEAKADLASLSSMLSERWKGGAPAGSAKANAIQPGQIRSVRLTRLDAEAKAIEGELL